MGEGVQYVGDEILAALQAAATAFALQAYRDSGDPEMLAGWRKLQEQMQRAIARMPKTLVMTNNPLERA